MIGRKWVPCNTELQDDKSRMFVQRIRSFQTFVRTLWEHNGYDPEIKNARCVCGLVNVRLNCVKMFISWDRIGLVDRALAASTGVVRNPKQLDGFSLR